jgi:hypothetical protein
MYGEQGIHVCLTDDEAREASRQAGRYWAAKRQVVRSLCAYCGKEFEGLKKRKYCCNAHRVNAFKRRQREAK